jgi:hypothetical protein
MDFSNVCEYIKNAKLSGKTDKQLVESFINQKTREFVFSFSQCSFIDEILTEKETRRGYWRSAYDYPVEGQRIKLDKVYCVAENVGLFTFHLREETPMAERSASPCSISIWEQDFFSPCEIAEESPKTF